MDCQKERFDFHLETRYLFEIERILGELQEKYKDMTISEFMEKKDWGDLQEAEVLFRELDKKAEAALNNLIKCECGEGTEMDEVQLKVPIDQDDQVMKVLGEAGYDVGSDAFYEDPDRFVTVIVRPGKSTLRR